MLRAAERPWLGALALTAGLMEEFSGEEPGADSIVHALLDVVFTYALREIAKQCRESQAGRSHAVRDAQVRRILTLMHQNTAHPWTLDELAKTRGSVAHRIRRAIPREHGRHAAESAAYVAHAARDEGVG